MLVGESNGTNQNQHGHQGHKQDVSRVPQGVIAGLGALHDVGNVLHDLFLKGVRNLHVSFVTDSILGRYYVVVSLNELNGQRGVSWRGSVGQLVGVLDEAFGKDPMGGCSGDQVKNPQRSFPLGVG